MTEHDMLQEISKDVKILMVGAGETAVEINHIKEAIRPISGLVGWRNRWGGGLIAISLISTMLGLAGTTLAIMLAVRGYSP